MRQRTITKGNTAGPTNDIRNYESTDATNKYVIHDVINDGTTDLAYDNTIEPYSEDWLVLYSLNRASHFHQHCLYAERRFRSACASELFSIFGYPKCIHYENKLIHIYCKFYHQK